MNILVLTSSIKEPDDIDNSTTNVVLYFAKSWVESGHRVVLIHNESKFPYCFYKLPRFVYKILKKKSNTVIPSVSSRKVLFREEDGVSIARFPIFKIVPHSRFFKYQYLKQFKRIIDYLNNLKFVPDVVTGHWIEPQLVLVNKLSDHFSSKSGIVFHSEIPNGFPKEYFRILGKMSCVFFRNKHTLEKTLDVYENEEFTKKRTAICYSGIPEDYTSQMKQRSFNRDIFTICYAGRLVDYKKIDSIIEALVLSFPKKDFCFHIVGDGPSKGNLLDICKNYDIERNVIFHGALQRKETKKIMESCDCFAMISINEVFGLVYLEAMSCGCITIASKDGGLDGIINDGFNGFLCEQGNHQDLVRILNLIVSMSDNEIEVMQKNAFDTVKNYTDIEVSRRYLKELEGEL